MKVYLFDVKTGLYEGETFEAADIIESGNGVTHVPPPEHEQGKVPVFDRVSNSWIVIPISTVRQLLQSS